MRTSRLAITAVFLADGVMLGSWASRVPAVQRHAELTSSGLGLALFAMSLGALLSMPLAGWLGDRSGSGRVTVVALIGGAVSLVAAALAAGLGALAAALFGFGAAFGAVNVSANAQGLVLERAYGRPILSSFHAAFSAGGLAGAGLGALAASGGLTPLVHFLATALVLVPTALVAGTALLPAEATGSARAPVAVRLPRPLLAVAAAAFFTLLAEGAAADWSAVYLSGSLETSAGVAALGYAAFSLAMAASRSLGDRLNSRIGPAALARGGGLLAAAGLTVALGLASTPAALAGFTAMGAGLGVLVPVLFRAAGTTPGIPAGAGIAAVSTIGWLGFLAGPPAIGFAADAFGLAASLWIVVCASALAALLAGRSCLVPSEPSQGVVASGAALEPACR